MIRGLNTLLGRSTEAYPSSGDQSPQGAVGVIRDHGGAMLHGGSGVIGDPGQVVNKGHVVKVVEKPNGTVDYHYSTGAVVNVDPALISMMGTQSTTTTVADTTAPSDDAEPDRLPDWLKVELVIKGCDYEGQAANVCMPWEQRHDTALWMARLARVQDIRWRVEANGVEQSWAEEMTSGLLEDVLFLALRATKDDAPRAELVTDVIQNGERVWRVKMDAVNRLLLDYTTMNRDNAVRLLHALATWSTGQVEVQL